MSKKIKQDTPLTPKQQKLAEDNWGLLVSFYQKHKGIYCSEPYQRFNDIYYDELVYAYLRAIRVWKKEKGTIGTITYYCMTYSSYRFGKAIIPLLLKRTGHRNTSEVEEKGYLTKEQSYFGSLKRNKEPDIEISEILNSSPPLTLLERKVLELRYAEGFTLSQVAKILFKEGIFLRTKKVPSRQLISGIAKRAKEKIRASINNV